MFVFTMSRAIKRLKQRYCYCLVQGSYWTCLCVHTCPSETQHAGLKWSLCVQMYTCDEKITSGPNFAIYYDKQVVVECYQLGSYTYVLFHPMQVRSSLRQPFTTKLLDLVKLAIARICRVELQSKKCISHLHIWSDLVFTVNLRTQTTFG